MAPTFHAGGKAYSDAEAAALANYERYPFSPLLTAE
jgi:hypothetical protein